MEQIKVSIIVPVYNTAMYLRKCLDSLLNQTLEEIEVIAVNDGSTDDSGSILDEYSLKYCNKIKIIHKKNGGQASARNLALGLCKGEYIGFLDSDDYVKPEMFEKMYIAGKELNADYVACGYTDITYIKGKEHILQSYVASKPAKEQKDLFFGALVSPFLHIYKSDIILKSQVFFPEGIIYEDTAFYINLVPYLHKIATINEPLAIRVRRSNSTTTTFLKERVANIFPVIENSIKFYKDNNYYVQFYNELEYFYVKILLCSSMQRISKIGSYKEALELTNDTINFINKEFADYRINIYFKTGKINLYMKSFNAFTSKLYLCIFRLINKYKRNYS